MRLMAKRKKDLRMNGIRSAVSSLVFRGFR